MFFLVSCEKEIQIEIPSIQDTVVVNSIMVVQQPIVLYLSKTHSPMTEIDEVLDEATIIIRNGQETDTLENTGEGQYVSHVLAECNTAYEMWAYLDGNLIANSFDKLLSSPFELEYNITGFADSIGIDEEGARYAQFEITFRDDKSAKNYYEIAVEQRNVEQNGLTYNNIDCYSDDIAIQAEGTNDFFPRTVLFSDSLFSGLEKHMIIRYLPIQWSTGGMVDYDRLVVHFRSVSENYYKYKKKLYEHLAGQDDSFWEGEANPVPMFTNINGGYGIFAGYAERIDTIQRIR